MQPQQGFALNVQPGMSIYQATTAARSIVALSVFARLAPTPPRLSATPAIRATISLTTSALLPRVLSPIVQLALQPNAYLVPQDMQL